MKKLEESLAEIDENDEISEVEEAAELDTLSSKKDGKVEAEVDITDENPKKKKAIKEDFESEDEVIEESEEIVAPEPFRVSASDFSVEEDVDAMLEGIELSDAVKAKVLNIFEAAVVAKTNEVLEAYDRELAEHYDRKLAIELADLEEALASEIEALEEQADKYLSYVAEQWKEENKVALQSNLRNDLMESFMDGLKRLFTEHYIDVPEDQVSVIDDLAEQIDILEAKLNAAVEENVNLIDERNSLVKESIIQRHVEGLSDNEASKLTRLAEAIEFDPSDFEDKLTEMKSSYFSSKRPARRMVIEEEEIELNEEVVEDTPDDDPAVRRVAEYMKKYT